ncbi:hypothetical protein D3C72_901660 [compost metagenome]
MAAELFRLEARIDLPFDTRLHVVEAARRVQLILAQRVARPADFHLRGHRRGQRQLPLVQQVSFRLDLRLLGGQAEDVQQIPTGHRAPTDPVAVVEQVVGAGVQAAKELQAGQRAQQGGGVFLIVRTQLIRDFAQLGPVLDRHLQPCRRVIGDAGQYQRPVVFHGRRHRNRVLGIGRQVHQGGQLLLGNAQLAAQRLHIAPDAQHFALVAQGRKRRGQAKTVLLGGQVQRRLRGRFQFTDLAQQTFRADGAPVSGAHVFDQAVHDLALALVGHVDPIGRLFGAHIRQAKIQHVPAQLQIALQHILFGRRGRFQRGLARQQ